MQNYQPSLKHVRSSQSGDNTRNYTKNTTHRAEKLRSSPNFREQNRAESKSSKNVSAVLGQSNFRVELRHVVVLSPITGMHAQQ